LISGGGSALMTHPYVPLEDMQILTSALLACGARIDEINILRRRLDSIKGGGLALATKAKVFSLILSDVIGNPLEAIASGPTYPDPTNSADAVAMLKKYDLEKKIPKSIPEFFNRDDSPHAPTHDINLRVKNIIVGDNRLASIAAMEQAEKDGIDAEVITNELQGEARDVGAMLAGQLKEEVAKRKRPFCIIVGGETTVTLRGDGKGGRNQELVLAAVDELRDEENVMLIAMATDGEDGPTDAAGAVVTGESSQRADMLGRSAADYLSRNDAYHFFQRLDDLIRTGPSGTNVNDLVFLFAL